MKDDDSLIGCLIYVICAVVTILVCKWVFESVMATDWPDWVKYMILK